MNSRKRNLTEGSIAKYLITLGLPVMMGMGMNYLYTLADTFWVGRIGPRSVAAVTLCGNLFFFMFAFAQTIGTGALAIVARHYGKVEEEKSAHTVRNVVFISIIIGVAITGITILFERQIVTALGAKGALVQASVAYLRPFCIGFFFQLLAFAINFSLRGAGDMMLPMIILFISTVSNVILDPFMIFGWGPFPAWGVAGAGIATAVSQALSAVLILGAIATGRARVHVPFVVKFKPDWTEIWNILKIGAPVGMQFLLISMSFMILTRIVTDYGEGTLAAVGISGRLIQITAVPIIGMGAAVSAIVGQNLAVQKTDRAMRAVYLGVVYAAVVTLLISILFCIFPAFLMSLFTDSKEVIRIGMLAIRIMAVGQVFIGVTIVFQNCFSGAGDTMPTMISAAIRAVVLLIAALFLPRLTGFGIVATISSVPISNIVGMGIMIYFFRLGRWKTRMDRIEAAAAFKPIVAPAE